LAATTKPGGIVRADFEVECCSRHGRHPGEDRQAATARSAECHDLDREQRLGHREGY
jgi:hypothetical protein